MLQKTDVVGTMAANTVDAQTRACPNAARFASQTARSPKTSVTLTWKASDNFKVFFTTTCTKNLL